MFLFTFLVVKLVLEELWPLLISYDCELIWKTDKIQESRRKEKAAETAARKDKKKEEDDDPSQRAFDKEKDMALGSKISASQRRDMISKASDFGSRFSKGKFL